MESIMHANSLDKDFIDCRNLITELEVISNTENIKETYNRKNDIKYIEFKEWLINNGVIYEKNFEYPTSFGIFNVVGIKSKKDIQNNEALLYIPHKIIIDSFKLRKTEEFQKIFDHPELKLYEKLNIIIITIFLLKEYSKLKSKQYSFWEPYINLIDSESLIFWDDDLLYELDDPNIKGLVTENRNDLSNYYIQLTKFSVIDAKLISFDQFVVYYSFALSRNFYVNDAQLLLVPLADALNHKHVNVKYEIFDSANYVCKNTLYFDDSIKAHKLKRTDNSLYYSSNKNTNASLDNIGLDLESINKTAGDHLLLSRGDYFIISTSDQVFKQGEQVFNFYSELSNECLLKWYGFCYFNNIYDFVRISLHLPKNQDIDFDYFLNTLFQDNLSETYQKHEIFNTLNFQINSRKINLKLMKYARFFYFYENDCVDEFFDYEFDMNIEIEVLKRCVELLEISYVNKSKTFKLDEDLKKLRKIYYEQNLENEIVLKYRMRLSNVLICRISQKMNLMNQIEMLKSILGIFLNGINFIKKNFEKDEMKINDDKNSSIKSKRKSKIYDFTSDQIFKDNKKKIKNYFKNFKLL